MKKYILVTQTFDGIGFCFDKRLKENGDEVVIAYQNIPKDDKDLGEDEEGYLNNGDELIKKYPLSKLMAKREKLRDWYWIWDLNGNCEEAEILRSEGFKVFGGFQFTYDLENDRKFGIEFAESCGLISPEFKEFHSVEEGVAFLEEHEDKAYVYKPNNEDNAYTTVPISEEPQNANIEIRRLIKSLGFTDYILQEKVKGIEVNVESFYVKGKLVFTWANLENKKIADGEMGIASGCSGDIGWQIDDHCELAEMTVRKFDEKLLEMEYTGFGDANVIISDYNQVNFLEFCFDNKTEIMTKNGWKLIKDVPIGTEVATLNRKTHNLEYQNTTDLIIQDYKGEMVSIGGKKSCMDVLMTPNHHQYVRMPRSDKYQDIEAKDLKAGMVIKRDAIWKGKEQKYFIIPEYIEKHYLGKYHRYIDIPREEKKILMDDWLRFLAIYLSDGSINGKSSGVNIYQKKYIKEYHEIISKLPFYYSFDSAFRISGIQLGSYMKQFGTCSQKFIPNYVKELTPRQIRVFLDAYLLGDGSVHKRTGQKTYRTTSKQMSDDLQELILKSGSLANILENNTKGTEVKGLKGNYIRNFNCFIISEREKEKDFWITGKNIKRKNYNGKVYCVTVPNHTIYVRRNGKPMWTANCFRSGYNSHPGLFINLASKSFLETCADMIDGNFDTQFKKGFGATLTLFTDKHKEGLPVYIPETLRDKTYLFFVMKDKDGLEEDDICMSGYSKEICITTAHDYDIKSALESVVYNAEKIKFSNRYFRTDLINDKIPNNPISRYRGLKSMNLC